MVINENGYVALRYFQSINKYVSIGDPVQREYLFVSGNSGVSLAWIAPQDVDRILAMKKMCCGGNENPMFHYANERDVQIWTGAV
jgi:hypothetical protein